MSQHRATYNTGWNSPYYDEYPSVLESVQFDEDHRIWFLLSDQARVRLINPHRLELCEAEGTWGELRQALYVPRGNPIMPAPHDFMVEVLNGGFCWSCNLSNVKDAISELRAKISRRNLQIESLREKLGARS